MRLLDQIRQAYFSLRQSLGFCLMMIFTLALTLGALLASYNLNQLIAFKDLPYPQADQLYVFEQAQLIDDKLSVGGQIAAAQFVAYQQGKAFSQSALIAQSRGILVSEPGQPMLNSLYVTHEYFDLLGVRYALGDGFSTSEQAIEAKAETVLSFDLWQTQFGGRENIIGQSIAFQDHQFTIVGVTSSDFTEPKNYALYGQTDLLLPLAYSQFKPDQWRNPPRNFASLLKLFPQTSVAEVSEKLSALINQQVQASEVAELYQGSTIVAQLTPLDQAIRGDSAHITFALLGGALVLLFIAFSNVVNLYLSHLAKKQRELAICASVGARPVDIFKRLFTESLMICLVASGFGLIICGWLMIFIREIGAANLPRLNELSIDISLLGFALLLAISLALLLAYFGQKVVAYEQLKRHLSASGKGVGSQISSRIRQVLIASQIALTGLLLIGASMVLQNALQLVNTPVGVNVDQVVSFQIDAGKNYPTPAEKNQMLDQVKQHFLNLPWVEKASKNFIPPIRVGNFSAALVNQDSQPQGVFGYSAVDSDYFNLLQQPILKGRNFSVAEVEDSARVTVISETVAQRLFADKNPVGQSIYFSPTTPIEVIGVTRDHFNAFTHDLYQGNLYFPYNPSRLNVMIKLIADKAVNKIEILDQLQQFDPSLRILEYHLLSQTKQDLVYRYKLAAGLAMVMSVFALMLACAGTYGLLSYSTQLRRFELGVRMALGAKTQAIIKLLMLDALKPILSGLVICGAIATLLKTLADEPLEALGTPQLTPLFCAIILLMLFSLLACLLPVKKIIKQDPLTSLRNE